MSHVLRTTSCQRCGKTIKLTVDHRRRGIVPKWCLPVGDHCSSNCKMQAYWKRRIEREAKHEPSQA